MHAVLTKLLTTLSPRTESAEAEAPELSRSRYLTADDRALVGACQQGDAAAQRQLYQRYSHRVFSVVARIAGHGDAEEITQEVFLRAFRGIATFRGESQLSTWLYRLAVNAALTHAGKTARRQRYHAGEDALQNLSAEPAHESDPLLRERLSQAMSELPPGYRAVLVLHDIEGLEHEEIGTILGVRTGTSKSQLHKARARMRELLGGVSVGEGEAR